MTAQPKSVIKTYFESGDRPTQSQFSDLIDSYQDTSPALTVLSSASTGIVGLQLLGCNTSASAQSIIGVGGGTTVSAANIIFNNSNRLLGNVSAGVGTELSSTDFLFSGTTINLNPTAVSAGTYASPTIVVDSKGRITSATPGSGSSEVVLLGTGTASSSASLNFTSLISSAYDYYFFILKDLVPSTSSILWMRASIDNGSNYISATSNYSSQLSSHVPGGTTITVTGVATGTATALIMTASTTGAWQGKVNLLNPLSASNVGGVFWDIHDDSNGNIVEGYGNFGNPAVNAVQFLPSTGTLTSGKIYMYGVKNT